MEQLFTQALGLSPPWSVVSVDFQPAASAIVFAVECEATRWPCPACSAPGQPIHDRIARRWQPLHFFQFRAYIDARLPRVACSACGKTTQAQPPWSRAGSGFSLVMEAFVIALCQGMPVAHVARLVEVSDDRIWRVLHHHVDQARAREDFSTVRRVGVDETSARRGQRDVTVFHDADARRLLFATPGRDAGTFAAFAQDLQAHGGEVGALTALRALDEVRRAEVKVEPDLKGSRWGLLKRASGWTRDQITQMHWLQRSGLKTARAWRLKEALRRLYEARPDAQTAAALLDRWICWARRSRLPAFKRLGATLRTHREGIVEHFRSGLSQGFGEAMNAQIQAAKARAKG
jgi:transposase